MSQVAYYKNADMSISVNKIPEEMRIGGTAFSAICGQSDFSTPFKTECEMLGIYQEPDNPAMQLGRTMESVLIQEYEEMYDAKVTIFPAIDDDYGAWDYHFKKGVFGAHVDGLVSKESYRDTIIEVKTSSNPAKWLDDGGCITIPPGYYLQASLYAWIVGARRIEYIVGFVEPSAYADPDAVPPHTMRVFEVVPMHIDNPAEFDKYLQTAMAFYRALEEGKTVPPDMTSEIDRKVFRELFAQDLEDETLSALLYSLHQMKDRIAEMTANYSALEAELKNILNHKNDGEKVTICDTSGAEWTYCTTTRNSVSYAKACKENNIDTSKYTTQTVSETLKMKEPKARKEE